MNNHIVIKQYTGTQSINYWEVQWKDKDGDKMLETFDSFVSASRYVEELL